MWKKAAVIVMCLAFLLSMTGCGKGTMCPVGTGALDYPAIKTALEELPIQVHRRLKKPMQAGQVRQPAALLRRVHRLEASRKKRQGARPVHRQQHNTGD